MIGAALHCLRCGYDWVQKTRWLPKKCPNCMQIHWDRPYKLRTYRGMTHQPTGRRK